MQFSLPSLPPLPPPPPPTPRVGCELPDVVNNNSSVSPVLCGQLPRASMERRLHSWGLVRPGANWDRKPPLPCWSAGLLGDRQTLIPSSVVSSVSSIGFVTVTISPVLFFASFGFPLPLHHSMCSCWRTFRWTSTESCWLKIVQCREMFIGLWLYQLLEERWTNLCNRRLLILVFIFRRS